MSESSLLQALTNLIIPLAESLDLEIWGVELGFAGRNVLRIYVERPKTPGTAKLASSDVLDAPDNAELSEGQLPEEGRVGIEQCAELSRLVGLTLDVEDVMPGAYVLEVSSPGLERIFFKPAQLARATGQTVEVSLTESPPSFQGRRKFRGILESAPAPDAADTVEEGAPFVLRLSGEARPGEEAPALVFFWPEVKKARQVWVIPEKTLPGKGPKKGGTKNKENGTALPGH